MQLEICVTNVESCLAAKSGGANRVELCAALDVGGVTPSAGLISAAVELTQLPVHVLIRPREGNFIFSKFEQQTMIADIERCASLGAKGVVVGALLPDGALDLTCMKNLVAAAQNLEITCHRAFDFCKYPIKTLEQLIDLGFHRVLTSGQAASAFEGRFLLQKLVEHANGRIQIMPGGGIHAGNIVDLAKITGATHFHVSAKKKATQNCTAIRTIQHLDENYWVSSATEIEHIRKLLNNLSG